MPDKTPGGGWHREGPYRQWENNNVLDHRKRERQGEGGGTRMVKRETENGGKYNTEPQQDGGQCENDWYQREPGDTRVGSDRSSERHADQHGKEYNSNEEGDGPEYDDINEEADGTNSEEGTHEGDGREGEWGDEEEWRDVGERGDERDEYTSEEEVSDEEREDHDGSTGASPIYLGLTVEYSVDAQPLSALKRASA